MLITTDPLQDDALRQMREVLQGDFLSLRVSAYELREDFDAGRARVACALAVNGEAPIDVLGEGVGMIDAVFGCLKARFAPEHASLDSITFSSLQVKGLIGDAKGRGPATDAKAEARIGVKNSYGNEFVFASVSESVSRSSVEAVTAAVEYFVNSERAYVTMFRALEHYEREGRVDLVAKYTDRLSDMVRNTSYSDLIERLKGR